MTIVDTATEFDIEPIDHPADGPEPDAVPRKRMRRSTALVLASVAVLELGCGTWWVSRPDPATSSTQVGSVPNAEPAQAGSAGAR
jgi:hypothetical protein